MDVTVGSPAANGLSRYIGLVFIAVGAPEDGYSVDLEPPVSAYIAMEQRIPHMPLWDFALTWDEINGWAGVIETSTAPYLADYLIPLTYLGIDVLPAPRVVARFADALVRSEMLGQPDPPQFRTVDTDDDLLRRLAQYAPL